MKEKVNGLLGRSLKHSFSVTIHRELGNAEYRLYEIEPEQLKAFLLNNDIELLNVTIPYKKSVLPFCAELSEEAQAIGSVNTIVSTQGGLYGHNTDAYGFAYMAARAGISFAGKKVLIFGSGGASNSAVYVAKQAEAASVTVISRSGENNYETLAHHADAEILVNATPVGMYPAEIGNSVVNLADFPRCEGVLDMVYNPLRTALIIQAEERRIACEGGLSMLVAQAKAAAGLVQEGRGWCTTFWNKKWYTNPVPPVPVPCAVSLCPSTERVLSLLLSQQENIVLIGMPGCGKNTIGETLASLSGRELVVLDDKIEEAARMTIPEIFNRFGEEIFRDFESEQTALYGKEHGLIIAAGGGVIKRERNYAPLHQNGRIYHVERDTALLVRVGRPLSAGADLEQLYEERLPLYTRFRDVVIENSGAPHEAAENIWKEFNEYTHHQRS